MARSKQADTGQEGAGGPGFVHLRVRSAYSLLEGALPIKRLVALAAADEMPALAVTDTGNLFGALEFSATAAEAGIQPVIGITLAVNMGDDRDEGAALNGGALNGRARGHERPSLALIAADETGYRNLIRLSSRAFLDTPSTERPHVTIADIADHAAGVIALTGGPGGPIDMALGENRLALASQRLERLKRIFGGRLYVELQRHGLEHERAAEAYLIDFAHALALPLVATNDAMFPTATDYEAHDALLCIAEGKLVSDDDRRQLTPEHHFKTRREMRALFADIPEALDNTVEIARRCTYWPLPAEPMLPRFAAGDEDAELVREARAGLDARLAAHPPAEGFTADDYHERLESELKIIAGMKYSGYFLIVADFIKWAKAQSIPVGPGRGSGAGSVVAWSLTITDLDPIRFGLLFERFLNPERVSMPDFDIDFCQDRRDEVIRYVQQRYGADQVAQIITFGTLQARAVLRDVGRVLEMGYGEVDRLAKLVPYNPANPVSLGDAIAGEPRLQDARDTSELVAQLLRIALRLEGLYRHASTHAAGIVIGDRPLAEVVPLYRDPRAELPVTQFNMKWVEQAGLVKFDFLGLKTLTVIDGAVRMLKERGVTLDILQIPLDDPATYEMLAQGATAGVFQFESAGMRDLMVKAEPTNFEDLIAIVALYRPGPMENIPKYLAAKHGREKPEYLHETIEPVVEDTYGVIIYQEQVMQIAQVFAGYTLGEADLLRRAMGKKIKKEMDAQRARFIEGAQQAHGVDRRHAEYVFDLVDKFAGYGFNKSHSAAYALIAYQTAYLKAHYPVEFIAASMTLDMNNTDKLNDFRREAQRLGIRLAPPSVNASGVAFRPEGDTIFYALSAIKTVGRQAVEHIVAERERGGPFRSVADFANRVNPRMLNKRALENLAAAGAFDELEENRAAVVAGAETILNLANHAAETRAHGQNELFGGQGAAAPPLRLPDAEPWLPYDRLAKEFEAVGFFLSGHPLDDYMPILKQDKVQTWAEFQESVERGDTAGKLAGTVLFKQEKRARSGNRFAFVGLSDPTGQYEAVVFADTLNAARELLEPGQSVMLRIESDMRDNELRLRVQSVEALDIAAGRVPQRSLEVHLSRDGSPDMIARRLPEPGNGEVSVIVPLPVAPGRIREVTVRLPGRYDLTPQAAAALKALPGVTHVELA